MRDGEEWQKKGYLKTINIMWVIKAMTLIQEMWRWWLKYKTEHYTLQVSRSGDKFLYFKLPNMYCEGQKISFSCVAIAHSLAYIITDLCWQEQIVSTKEGDISFSYLLCATKKLRQDPEKTITVHHSTSFMQCWRVKLNLCRRNLLYSISWTKHSVVVK